MAKSACKCKEVECEECPEWIFTLADLIMCMMGLFVILWCLKPGINAPLTPHEENLELIKMLAAIRDAFGSIPDADSNDPVDVYRLAQKLQLLAPHKGPGLGGQTNVKPKGADGSEKTVMSIRNGRHSLVGSRVLFAPGKDDLSPESRKILDEIAEIIRGHRNVFMIKGHADLDDFPDNGTAEQQMELSLRRAKVVNDYLVSKGIDRETLAPMGRSVFEPIAERVYTTETRQPNRRVEVQSLDQLVEDYKDQPEPQKPLNSTGNGPESDRK
jgi:outer membrane protein OmpA-like peptidoglycan-associated protein